MKITSSTSITSISGVMLMSLIGCAPGLRSRRPKVIVACARLRARRRGVAEAISRRSCAKPSSSASHEADHLAEDVVGEHGGNGHREAGGRHHERLADRAGDLLDRDRAAGRDADQRMVDAPHGAEQADEGRRAADRGEQHLAPLQLRQHAVQRAAQAARELRLALALAFERGRVAGCSVAASSSGCRTPSRSNSASCARPSASVRAAQKAGIARSMSRRARRSSHAFQKIMTQALIDISSSSAATARVMASPCSQKACSPVIPVPRVPSSRARRPCRRGRCARPARKRAARRLPCGIGGAAARLVGDLDALAGAGEEHGVVADDVAAAHGREADGRRVALAGVAFARIDRAVGERRARARPPRPRPSAARCRSARRPCGGDAPR